MHVFFCYVHNSIFKRYAKVVFTDCIVLTRDTLNFVLLTFDYLTQGFVVEFTTVPYSRAFSTSIVVRKMLNRKN